MLTLANIEKASVALRAKPIAENSIQRRIALGIILDKNRQAWLILKYSDEVIVESELRQSAPLADPDRGFRH